MTFIGSVFVFSFLMLFGGFTYKDGAVSNNVINYDLAPLQGWKYLFDGAIWNDYGHSLSYIAQTMLFMRPEEYSTSDSFGSAAVKVLAYIFGTLLIVITGLALRRKFRRMSGEM